MTELVWALQILAAAQFFLTGLDKLGDAPAMVRRARRARHRSSLLSSQSDHPVRDGEHRVLGCDGRICSRLQPSDQPVERRALAIQSEFVARVRLREQPEPLGRACAPIGVW